MRWKSEHWTFGLQSDGLRIVVAPKSGPGGPSSVVACQLAWPSLSLSVCSSWQTRSNRCRGEKVMTWKKSLTLFLCWFHNKTLHFGLASWEGQEMLCVMCTIDLFRIAKPLYFKLLKIQSTAVMKPQLAWPIKPSARGGTLTTSFFSLAASFMAIVDRKLP